MHTVRGQIKQQDFWLYGLNKWSQLVKEIEKVEPKSSAFFGQCLLRLGLVAGAVGGPLVAHSTRVG